MGPTPLNGITPLPRAATMLVGQTATMTAANRLVTKPMVRQKTKSRFVPHRRSTAVANQTNITAAEAMPQITPRGDTLSSKNNAPKGSPTIINSWTRLTYHAMRIRSQKRKAAMTKKKANPKKKNAAGKLAIDYAQGEANDIL